ncbi:MAG TPA: hypothetical protein VNC41_08765, partial [Acidimicrobiia bacterium]|nr:hypothetical protein [Acidimicrobiia bacterium]
TWKAQSGNDMTAAFTPDAARAVGGPQWLVDRRAAAAEQLSNIAWPTAAEEIWRYSRIGELDLERYTPFRVKFADAGVAPDFFGGRRPCGIRKLFGRGRAPVDEPLWSADCTRRIRSECGGHVVTRLRLPC